MSPVVVDASVVAKLVFPEPHRDQAFALFDDAYGGHVIVAPYLMLVEVTNVVRKRMRRDHLTLGEAAVRLAAMLRLPIELLEPPDIHTRARARALALTAAHGLGAHDAHYVALATILGSDLWVDDGRVLRAVRDRLPFVKWIGDYRPASAKDR